MNQPPPYTRSASRPASIDTRLAHIDDTSRIRAGLRAEHRAGYEPDTSNYNKTQSAQEKAARAVWRFAFSQPPLRTCIRPRAGASLAAYDLVARLDAMLLNSTVAWAYVCLCWGRSYAYRKAGVEKSWVPAIEDLALALGLDVSVKETKLLNGPPPRRPCPPRISHAPPPYVVGGDHEQ